jgi:TolB-like protein
MLRSKFAATALAAAAFLCSLSVGVLPAAAAPADVPQAFRQDPLLYYFDVRFADALRYGETVLADASTPELLRDRTLVTIATVRCAQRRNADARAAFLRMLESSPMKDLELPARLPPAVTALFYQLRDSLCLAHFDELVEKKQLSSNIRTIAVGDIENNSIIRAKYDMDQFSRGLVHVLTSELASASQLKIVDRQRLNVLLQELDLARDPSAMDPKNRVRLGKLTGAQSYLFGQVMQLEETRLRYDLRWVDTSTGEILLARSVEGSFASAADLLKLEHALLVDTFAPAMDQILRARGESSNLRQELEKSLRERGGKIQRNTYVRAIEERGRALQLESTGAFGPAADVWDRIATLAPEEKDAAVRAKSLRAFGSGKAN